MRWRGRSGSPFSAPTRVDGAVAEVLPLYKVDAETLRRDVEALLQSIAKAGLLE